MTTPDTKTLVCPAGVPDWAWSTLAKPDGNRWAIPERDAAGEIIGTAYRLPNGDKDFKPGGRRGLILPWPLNAYAGSTASDPVYVCEGASDTAAMIGLGVDAVGVPMAGYCGDMLAELLADRHAVIVSDADNAGRKGTEKIRAALLARCETVRTIEPPGRHKDARAAVIAGVNREAFESAAARAEPDKTPPVPIDGAPVLVRLSEVTPEEVQWLYPGRIALGKLNLLAGDPGLGKSFVSQDMAARVTRGIPWPDAPDVPQPAGGVVLLSAEDGVSDTIVPRLGTAGADLTRVVVVSAVQAVSNGRASERGLDLSRDLPALEQAILTVGDCRLVVVDPVTAYLGDVDSHKNAEIRGLLAPLAALAAKHGVAVLMVDHLNKSNGRQAIYRTMGSIGTVAASRSAWVVTKDKDDPARRLVLPIKNNLAPDTGGLAYRIEAASIGAQPRVLWERGAVDVDANSALAAHEDKLQGRTECDDAADWLKVVLADGPRRATDIEREAVEAGIALGTLRRAKAKLEVESCKPAFGGPWEWKLPAAVGHQGGAS